jgi:hypothetical protein
VHYRIWKSGNYKITEGEWLLRPLAVKVVALKGLTFFFSKANGSMWTLSTRKYRFPQWVAEKSSSFFWPWRNFSVLSETRHSKVFPKRGRKAKNPLVIWLSVEQRGLHGTILYFSLHDNRLSLGQLIWAETEKSWDKTAPLGHFLNSTIEYEHWMRRAFWREYLWMSIFFPLGGTTVYGRRLYKVLIAPSIGITKHDAS